MSLRRKKAEPVSLKKATNEVRSKPRTSIDVEAIGKRASIVAYVFMLGAIGSIFALSWEGLTHFGQEVLGLDGWMVHIVPGSLDGAVIMFGCMAIVSMIDNENASGLRFLVQFFAVVSAVFNGYQGWKGATGDNRYFAGAYYAGLSILVALISHWMFRRIRRAARIDSGTLNVGTAHFPLAEWVRFPNRRRKARTLALEYGISDPRVAITLEASLNDRIDPRIMLALEAFSKNPDTRLYEFFLTPDQTNVGEKKGKDKRRKADAQLLTGEKRDEKPLLTGEKVVINGEKMGSHAGKATSLDDGRDESSNESNAKSDPGENGENSREKIDNPAISAGQEGLCALCGPTDSQVDPSECRHVENISTMRSGEEAARFAMRYVGTDNGMDVVRWLQSHGSKSSQGTIYRWREAALKSPSLRLVNEKNG
ncbi:hypothetical protein AB0D86_48100 [Streptomyces sp. NPDC048324]|uniref:hypothetical protein n=1 Tax=Streptomyces sp. NPDC048324 TaxID=3157205 RepID=UPI00343E9550